MKLNRLYDDLADLWPLVSPPEDYAAGAKKWRDVLREKLGPGRHEILELGAGGGHNLSHLTDDFEATAVDLSEKMLRHSIRLNPGVDHHAGDMRTVRLGKKFKAVIIHDAISYLLSEDDIRLTFETVAAHLEPSGVFLAAPDHFRETFQDPNVHCHTRSDGETVLTFIEYDYDPDPGDTTVESLMFYLIRKGRRLRVERDRHVSGLFPLQTWVRLMEEAGFRVGRLPLNQEDDSGQPFLFVGTPQHTTP